MAVEWGDIEKRLGGASRRLRLGAGDVLFRCGGETLGMYALVAGRMKMVRFGPDGRETLVHAVVAGESFAEPSLFSPSYHCDCIAETAAEVIVLPKREMLRLIAEDGGFAALLVKRLATQVRDLRARIELRNIRSAEERVLAALDLRYRDDGRPIALGTTLKVFASEIGLTHEALYRALARLQRSGRLRRAGTDVWLR